jgi:hypothetical protein
MTPPHLSCQTKTSPTERLENAAGGLHDWRHCVLLEELLFELEKQDWMELEISETSSSQTSQFTFEVQMGNVQLEVVVGKVRYFASEVQPAHERQNGEHVFELRSVVRIKPLREQVAGQLNKKTEQVLRIGDRRQEEVQLRVGQILADVRDQANQLAMRKQEKEEHDGAHVMNCVPGIVRDNLVQPAEQLTLQRVRPEVRQAEHAVGDGGEVVSEAQRMGTGGEKRRGRHQEEGEGACVIKDSRKGGLKLPNGRWRVVKKQRDIVVECDDRSQISR